MAAFHQMSFFSPLSQVKKGDAFLAATGLQLGNSLDWQSTLHTVSSLALSGFGSWCAIDLFDEGRSERLLSRTTGEQRPSPPVIDPGHPAIAMAFRNRRAVLAQQTALVIPLATADRALGTLVVTRSKGHYARTEIELGEVFGRYAANAIRNAELHRDAKHAIRVREEFLSVASHELKTPICSLQLQLEAAQSLFQSENPKAGEIIPSLLYNALKQCGHLTRLIHEVLNMAQLGAHRLELRKECVDLLSLTNEVCERMAAELQRAGCEVHIRSHGSSLGNWDRIRIEQVLSNLISNALKYGQGKPIQISIEGTDDQVEFRIRDEGLGIPKEDQKRVFDAYERIHGSSQIDGFGLGLYIAKNIVQSHHGEISVRSSPDQGSTFIVKLPKKISSAAKATA